MRELADQTHETGSPSKLGGMSLQCILYPSQPSQTVGIGSLTWDQPSHTIIFTIMSCQSLESMSTRLMQLICNLPSIMHHASHDYSSEALPHLNNRIAIPIIIFFFFASKSWDQSPHANSNYARRRSARFWGKMVVFLVRAAPASAQAPREIRPKEPDSLHPVPHLSPLAPNAIHLGSIRCPTSLQIADSTPCTDTGRAMAFHFPSFDSSDSASRYAACRSVLSLPLQARLAELETLHVSAINDRVSTYSPCLSASSMTCSSS